MDETPYIAALDPGSKGALVTLAQDGSIVGTHPFSPGLILSPLASLLLSHAATPNWALEEVHAIHGAAARATFSFGRNYGVLLGILATKSIVPEFISPRIWTQLFSTMAPMELQGAGLAKKRSAFAFSKLYPELGHVRHDGIIDAALIGLFFLHKLAFHKPRAFQGIKLRGAQLPEIQSQVTNLFRTRVDK